MEYNEYYATKEGGISRVFVGSPYQHGQEIGSFLGRLFRKILFFLNKGMCAIDKNVIEDVENNTPLKEAMKIRFRESHRNLKKSQRENK